MSNGARDMNKPIFFSTMGIKAPSTERWKWYCQMVRLKGAICKTLSLIPKSSNTYTLGRSTQCVSFFDEPGNPKEHYLMTWEWDLINCLTQYTFKMKKIYILLYL